MKETVNSGRLDYFDIAKGLAMFCVIAGHMGMAQTFNPFAFSFHMPLFFLISGYFYKNDVAKVLRNTKRLLTAYLWTVLAVIILSEVMPLTKVMLRGDDVISLAKVAGHWALAGLYGSGARGDCLGMHLPAIGAVWFLLALAWGGCFLLIINKLQRSSHRLAACLLVFLAGWLSAKWTWLPLSIQSGMCATLFLFVGYKARTYRRPEVRRILLPVSAAIWGVALYLGYTNGYMEIAFCRFPNVIFNVAGGIFGTYVVIRISRWVEKIGRGAAYRFLLFWGRNTLIVLCAHLAELNCVPWWRIVRPFVDNQSICLAIIFCLKVLWAALAILLINKYKCLINKRKTTSAGPQNPS